MAESMSVKRVVVAYGSNRRVLRLPTTAKFADLKLLIRDSFSDVMSEADYFLQMKDEEWGEFLDVSPDDSTIPDKAVINVLHYKVF